MREAWRVPDCGKCALCFWSKRAVFAHAGDFLKWEHHRLRRRARVLSVSL